MKTNRKDFLRLTSLVGIGMIFGSGNAKSNPTFGKTHSQRFNMHGYAAPKLDTVRMGFIGIGDHGSGNVMRYASIEGVDIKALCDVVPSRVTSVIDKLNIAFPKRYNPNAYTGGADAWKKVCERDDIDLICISTPWSIHASMAVYAMEHNKHVYVDLPLGVTVEECWQVVETSERTRKHAYMDCVNCHAGIPAVLLNMARQGYFGEIVHGEGHYAHDRVSDTKARWVRDPNNAFWFGYRPWRLQENVNRNGNLYPPHGLAPVSQIMDLNYGDQMDYLVSISSNDFTMADKMKELAEMDEYYKPYIGLKFRGNMNTMVIRTHKGRTLMIQHDISSPGIGQRFDSIRGNKGMYKTGSDRDRIFMMHKGVLSEEEFDSTVEKYTPEITKKFNEKLSGAKYSKFKRFYDKVSPSDWRLIDCLRNGLPLDIDVYDGALWSVVTPLSERSVARDGASVKVPDFTCGAWRTNKRGMDISITEGGTTNLI